LANTNANRTETQSAFTIFGEQWNANSLLYSKNTAVYIAYVDEIPGVNTQGRTFAEARENLKEALQLILEENRRLNVERR
jgi:predicted RNase H-like HicB family nuclease